MSSYPPIDVVVSTSRLELRGATDDLPPWDDPHSFYEPDPEVRLQGWLRGIWRGRGTVRSEFWRLYFVVIVDDEPIGMQDLIGDQFAAARNSEAASQRYRPALVNVTRGAAPHLRAGTTQHLLIALTDCGSIGAMRDAITRSIPAAKRSWR